MSVYDARNGSYSADVRMQLRINGQVFAIGQLGPDFLILDEPADLPSSDGEIILSIDGRTRQWLVHLPDGVSATEPQTRIVDRAVDGPTSQALAS